MRTSKLPSTLDIGSHINVRFQPLPKAGAQRTLEAVACTPVFGQDTAQSHRPA
jgi:hypothetical protein